MSTCINRSHPDVIKLVEDTGLEVTTVAGIISLWQKNNMVDTFPTLQEFEEYKAQVQGKGFSDMYDTYFRFIANGLLENWTGVKGGESVSGLLKRFKRSISDKSGDSEVVLPEDALRHLLRVVEVGEGTTLGEGGVITPQSLTAALNALNGYLTTSEIYLRGMVSGLNDFLKSEEATPKQKISAIFHTHETALNYKRQLEAIFPKKGTRFSEMADFYMNPSYAPFIALRDKMIGHINNVVDAYDNQLKNEVVETLYNLIKHNSPAVEEQYDKEIKRFEDLLGKATRPGDIKYLKLQIEYEKKQKEANLITKKNISKWLSDPSVSWTGLMFRSSIYQQDAGTSLIARYITDALEEAKKEYLNEINDLQQIQIDMEKEANLGVDLRLDIQDVYKDYYRKTVDKNGNFALALQTPMLEQELINERDRLVKNVQEAQNEQDRLIAEEKLDEFDDLYVERRYVPAYYQYLKLLPPDIRYKLRVLRALRNEQIKSMDKLGVTSDDLIALQKLEKDIADLQREYDDFGNLKDEESLRIARIIKAYNEEAARLKIHDFELTAPSKRNFELTLSQKKTKLKEILDNPEISQEQKDADQEEFTNWAAIFTRTVIDPAFYELRNEVTVELDEIFEKYGPSTIGTLYKELFSILAGYKDESGVYIANTVSPQLVERTREIEEQIENLKQSDENRNVSQEDRKKIKALFQKLKSYQVTVTTNYYKDEVENRKNNIRSLLTTNRTWDDDLKLEQAVDKAFEKSDWFLANHILVTRYFEGERVQEYEPLYVWKQTVPSQLAADILTARAKQQAEELKKLNDPALKPEIDKLEKFKVMSSGAPSKIWYSYRVNPRYENPNYSPDLRFKAVKGAYYNQEWDKLSPRKQEIAERLLNVYQKSQEGGYTRNRLRTLVPYVRKEGTEMIYDTARFKRKGLGYSLKDDLRRTFNREDLQGHDVDDNFGEVSQLDAFGNPLGKTSKAIYMRYVRPLDENLMSFDIMKSIGLYMGESAKFRALRNHQSEILAMQSVFEKSVNTPQEESTAAYAKAVGKVRNFVNKKVGSDQTKSEIKAKEKELKRANAIRVTQGLINRLFYGENRKTGTDPYLNSAATLLNWSLRRTGAMTLGQNVHSTVKNLFAGLVQNYVLAGNYDVTAKDLAMAQPKALLATAAFLTNPTAGNRPLDLRILDFFGVIQGREFAEGQYLKNTAIRKYGNLFKTVHRIREATEYEIQATVAFAILNKEYVDGPNGTRVNILEAFDIVGGRLIVKPGYEVSNNAVRTLRAKIKQYNQHGQGIYDQIYQPEGTKYVLYRLGFYMGKWIAPKYDRMFGADRMDQMSGMRTQGAYNAVWQMVRDVIRAKNISGAWRYMNTAERKAFQNIMRTAIAMASFIVLQMLLKKCDDDGDQDACDYVNFYIKGVGDEIESLNPILYGPNFVYGFVYQKTQTSAPEKTIKSFTAPALKMWDLMSETWEVLLDPFEPSYKRKSNGEPNWNIMDPALAGLPAAVVLTLKFTGLHELDLSARRAEYKSRQKSYYSPKWFNYKQQTKTKYANKEGDVEIIESKEED
jgi:hypothetical protein